ncbi:hypothetical protein CLAIMM_10690, partial [Cladophialophora immunda]
MLRRDGKVWSGHLIVHEEKEVIASFVRRKPPLYPSMCVKPAECVAAHDSVVYMPLRQQNVGDMEGFVEAMFTSLRCYWYLGLVPCELRALGLSGVVMGLGAALFLAAPKIRVDVSRTQSLPGWLLMVVYIVYDASRLDDSSSEVAHAAHLGGAAFGAVFYFLALRGSTALPYLWLLQEQYVSHPVFFAILNSSPKGLPIQRG